MLFKIPPLLEVWLACGCQHLSVWVCGWAVETCASKWASPKKQISGGCSWDSTVAVAMGWNHHHPSWWTPGVSWGCFSSACPICEMSAWLCRG